jgi:vacuolar-type H+-ATPase subunit I/STV1
MPAFLKGKFGKKKEKVEEAASDYASEKMYKTANGKTAKIAEPTGDASSKNMASVKAKASAASGKVETPKAIKEEIAAMFSGQELSEEFKSQAATLFEAHINERVHQIEEQLKGQYEDLLEQHTVAVTEELVERIDEYLNYVVEEWMQENRLAVEQGLRTEITENFISNLRGLFAESYIEVPEEKLDLFESTVEQAEALDGELQEQVDKNIELAEEVEQLKCEIVFREIAEGLTDTDSEKLRRLAEDLEFDTVEQFAEKLGVLRENIESIGNTVTEGEAEEESLEESFEDASEASPLVEAFARSMSKSRE